MRAEITTLDAGAAGSLELNDEIFNLEPRADLLQRMVRWQTLKRMAGTHHTQDRSEVSVTGKKMYKQKGTGGARHGSRNAPIFVGGGVAHGPHPHSHAHALPKKVRALAMKHALSSKVKDESLVILDALSGEKTKEVSAQLKKLGIENALVIGGEKVDEKFAKAARNIPNIDVLPLAGLNVYDVMRRKTLVLTREAVEGVNARFAETEKA